MGSGYILDRCVLLAFLLLCFDFSHCKKKPKLEIITEVNAGGKCRCTMEFVLKLPFCNADSPSLMIVQKVLRREMSLLSTTL